MDTSRTALEIALWLRIVHQFYSNVTLNSTFVVITRCRISKKQITIIILSRIPLSNSVRAELASCSGSPSVLSFNVQNLNADTDIFNTFNFLHSPGTGTFRYNPL